MDFSRCDHYEELMWSFWSTHSTNLTQLRAGHTMKVSCCRYNISRKTKPFCNVQSIWSPWQFRRPQIVLAPKTFLEPDPLQRDLQDLQAHSIGTHKFDSECINATNSRLKKQLQSWNNEERVTWNTPEKLICRPQLLFIKFDRSIFESRITAIKNRHQALWASNPCSPRTESWPK